MAIKKPTILIPLASEFEVRTVFYGPSYFPAARIYGPSVKCAGHKLGLEKTRFLLALLQNKAQSRLLYLLNMFFNPLAFIFTNDHRPNKGRFWCLRKHPLSISSFSMQQWEEQLRTVLQASWSNEITRTIKKLFFNLAKSKRVWFLLVSFSGSGA